MTDESATGTRALLDDATGTSSGHDDSLQQATRDDPQVPLLPGSDAESFQERWEECQRNFVDDPKQAVQTADELVADVIKSLAEQFADARSQLEEQWDRGDEVSTEDLRQALQRYRSFFQRLLQI